MFVEATLSKAKTMHENQTSRCIAHLFIAFTLTFIVYCFICNRGSNTKLGTFRSRIEN